MRRSLLTVAALTTAFLVLLLQGSTPAASADPGARGGRTMRFTVSFSPFSYTDLGQPGPSAADVIVFHDQLSQGGTTVGDEDGSCVLVEATGVCRTERASSASTVAAR